MTGAPHPLSDEHLLAYVRLARTPSIGPVTFQRLLGLYKTPQHALDALPELAEKGGRAKPLKIHSARAAADELYATQDYGGQFLVWGETCYPPALAHIPDAPMLLSVYGHVGLLQRQKTISIVGARNASAAALKITAALSSELNARDFVIVSGLARGIDAMAHRHALPQGTIAVLGNGISHQYPPENKDLQEQIRQAGLLVCENPPATPPTSRQFPRRNRIISGLTLGVIVVEAARRSGSLISARLANEQGREVMAVPGSPLDTRCHGSNNLIREGASLIETSQDVLDIMQPRIEQSLAFDLQAKANKPLRYPTPLAPPSSLSRAERQTITELLGPTPTSIDELVTMSTLPVDLVHLAVLELEIAGRLTVESDGRMSLLNG
jgi:DNA processing protein